jgi:hypothetical protein
MWPWIFNFPAHCTLYSYRYIVSLTSRGNQSTRIKTTDLLQDFIYLLLIIDRDQIHKHYWLIGTDYLGSSTFTYHTVMTIESLSYSLVWPDRGSNPCSTALEASTLTIMPPMRFSFFHNGVITHELFWGVIHKHYWLIGTDYLGSSTFTYHTVMTIESLFTQ